MARLKERYNDEIRQQLIERFGYSSAMQAPRLQKITLNMGVGDAKQDSKVLDAATEQLATIAGQQPSVRRARKSIAQFKVREGMPVGLSVTLRRERAYEFLDRLMTIAIPRIRDFRGLKPTSFDGRGNYSLGVREQIIFPEIDYDAVDAVRGLDVTITTSAAERRRGLRPPRGVRHALQSRGQPLCAVRAVRERRERLMAKTSQRVRQARPAKYKTREYTRCRRCGRARSVYRKFGVCRICLRELAHNGYVPGMTKSSW